MNRKKCFLILLVINMSFVFTIYDRAIAQSEKVNDYGICHSGYTRVHITGAPALETVSWTNGIIDPPGKDRMYDEHNNLITYNVGVDHLSGTCTATGRIKVNDNAINDIQTADINFNWSRDDNGNKGNESFKVINKGKGDGVEPYVEQPDSNPIKIKTGGTCKINTDCPIQLNEACSACGTCVKREDLTDPDKVKIDYDLKPEFSEKSIKNVITKTAILRVGIVPKFSDETGKTISYCQISTPGINDKKLEASFTGKDPYAGFTTGYLVDPRDKSWLCDLDFKKEDLKCNFIISPNDKNKYIGETGEIREKIKLKADNKETETEISLLPMTTEDMKMEIQMSGEQVQDGDVKSIKVMVTDKESPTAIIRVSLAGEDGLFKVTAPGLAKTESEISTKQISFIAKPGKFENFGYKAPELSNTSFAELIKDAKTMGEFQSEAAKKILLDSGAAWLDEPAKVKKFGEFWKDANTYKSFLNTRRIIARGAVLASKTANKIYDINQTNENIGDVLNTGNIPPSSKGIIESGSEIAVFGLNAVDMTVGALMIIPSKVPIVGGLFKGVGLGTQVAFSSMINIWKANFQYLASNSKMERARELFYPVGMTITAEDISGWTLKGLSVVKVAYHQL